jgi:S-phase kinase-associated protein 1
VEEAKTAATGTVVLIPPDGQRVEVARNVAEMSVLIKEMLADDEDDETPEIPLPNVQKDILDKVIEFCGHHVNDPMPEIDKPLKSANMNDVVGDWDAKFIDVEQSTLFSIILAANYLDLPSLLDLSCAKVASMIKGKTPEEIRKTFNIVNDFTPEEEAQVREENKWCEEQTG